MVLCTYYLLLLGLMSMVGRVVMVDEKDFFDVSLTYYAVEYLNYEATLDLDLEDAAPRDVVEENYENYSEIPSKQKPRIYIYPRRLEHFEYCSSFLDYTYDYAYPRICHFYRISFNYSINSTCYTAVRIKDQVVITVCIDPVKISIIGHAFSEVSMPAVHNIIWIDATDIEEGERKQIAFINLKINVTTLDKSEDENIHIDNNIYFVQYYLLQAFYCEISGLFHFQYIEALHFVNCKLNFGISEHFFTGIEFLKFQNCTLSKLDNMPVTVFIRFSQVVLFISCDIFNNHDYELSLIISNIDDHIKLVVFTDCYFHTVSSYQENILLLYMSPFELAFIYFENCTVHGRNTFVIDGEAVHVSITNTQFTDIVSDNLLSISTSYSKSRQINNCIIIENSTFKNITSNKNILTSKIEGGYIDADGDLFLLVLQMFNVSFINNIGTPIFGNNGIDFHSVSFVNNTGTLAGAVFIEILSRSYGNLRVTLDNIQMLDNIHKTDNGGDVYIRVVTDQNNIVSRIEFANTSNTVIFFESSTSKLLNWSNTSSFQNIPTKYLKSFPRYIDTDHLFHSSDVFPGKSIFLSGSISVTDYFHNDASCNAVPSLQYDHNERDNCTIQLASNDKIQLKTGKEVMSSVYIIATSVDCLKIKGKAITLLMVCEHVTTSITLILRGCPLGYKPGNHSDQNGQQLLKCEVADEGHLIKTDDSKQHIACIDRDYWYGPVNVNGSYHPIKVYCGPPYCVQNTEACPLAGYTNTHQKLPWTQDEQCSGLYGGVLCRSCQEHAVFTFGASKCISFNDCKEWQPYLIICLAILGQIALSLVMICSRTKTTIGIGYLYGPLFFIAVYKLLPISNSYLLQTSPLEYTFSVYETVLLLDLDILGKVNWCMFNNINKTLLYSMRFIGPLVTFMVLLVIVLIARSNFCFKFKINRMIQSPIQPMCLLIILSFWSLSKTSIEIIKPIIINGEWRFAIQPEYNYLGNGYIIGLLSISVALLMCFYLPFIFLLFSSQFIRHKINLFCIQPILDAFQSSYKDKYQWFSSVYLFSWLVMNSELPSYAFVIVITGVSVLQFTLHPHKSKLLNITDNLLLADIIIMSSLSYMRNEDHAVMVIKYPLLIIPLIYILMGGVWLPLRTAALKCRSMILHRRQPQASNEAMQELMMPVEDALVDRGDIDVHANGIKPQDIIICNEMEREPLIYDDY